MNSGGTVFAQLIEHLPHKEFHRYVARYRGDRYAKNFSCWDQYLTMAFAQLTYRESLRDIETCLGAVGGKLYHMGFRTSVARSTLADANEARDLARQGRSPLRVGPGPCRDECRELFALWHKTKLSKPY